MHSKYALRYKYSFELNSHTTHDSTASCLPPTKTHDSAATAIRFYIYKTATTMQYLKDLTFLSALAAASAYLLLLMVVAAARKKQQQNTWRKHRAQRKENKMRETALLCWLCARTLVFRRVYCKMVPSSSVRAVLSSRVSFK